MTTPFPQRQWGSPDGLPARAASALAATKVGSRVIRALTPLDRRLLERTGARYTVLGPVGVPVILLTTTGRRSGQPRTQPLLCVHDGATLYIVGSNFGQAHHPAWTANLLANPGATVAIAGERIPVTAALVEGAAADAVFQRFVDITGAYAAYRTRTDRNLRIFALTRA
ncbi:nitroreductase family deazaflavin-dependent oxidoreductase [Nocardia sp. NPDC003345]